MRQTVLIRDLFWFFSPLLVFCITRVWLCQQHNYKDKTSKICKSFRGTHLFFTCPTCAYGQRITISRGLLRSPAAGSATGAGIGEKPRGERWFEYRPSRHVQHTSKLQQRCWELACGVSFSYLFCPTKESPAARAAFTGRCLKVPKRVNCAGHLQQQRVFNRCKDAALWGLEIVTWVLKKLMIVLDIRKFKLLCYLELLFGFLNL